MTTDEIMALADEYSDAHLQMVTQGGLDPLVFRDSLQSAIEALQADAARYRWLRDDAPHPFLDRLRCYGSDCWDQEVDALMALDKP